MLKERLKNSRHGLAGVHYGHQARGVDDLVGGGVSDTIARRMNSTWLCICAMRAAISFHLPDKAERGSRVSRKPHAARNAVSRR